ncbi:MAG TPA: hypothetical protein VLZ75_08225 [Chitinophagales bacterium]|nr:hypothetical protein [Chitinophagales bacterium]
MRFSIILISIFLFVACKKDDKNNSKNTVQILTDKGSEFKVTRNGTTETISGTSFFLDQGQLLEQSFFRQFRMGTSAGQLTVRFSFPSIMSGNVDENLYNRDHSLYASRLLLENTGSLNEVAAEAFFSNLSTKFNDNNASGKINMKKNHSINGSVYSIFGEVDMTVQGKDFSIYTVKGYFWNK